MKLDVGTFKDIASGLQSIVVALSFLVVGVWTIFTFDALQARDRAKAELEELQQRIHQQAVITVDLDASQSTLPGDDARYIHISAEIKNVGNRTIRLVLGDKVVAVTRITYDNQGNPTIGEVLHSGVISFADVEQTRIWNLPYTLLGADELQTIPFLIRVDDPGYYLVEFQAGLTGPEADDFAFAEGASTEHLFFSTAQTLLEVQ